MKIENISKKKNSQAVQSIIQEYLKEYLREFSEEYCDNKKRVAKKERKVLIIRDPIVWSLRKTKQRIKKVHYQKKIKIISKI